MAWVHAEKVGRGHKDLSVDPIGLSALRDQDSARSPRISIVGVMIAMREAAMAMERVIVEAGISH